MSYSMNLIAISEMAGWLGVSLSEAEDIVTQGNIPCVRVNGKIHVHEKDLNFWIERQFNFSTQTHSIS